MDTTTTMVMDTTTRWLWIQQDGYGYNKMVMDTMRNGYGYNEMVMDTMIRINLYKYFQLTRYQNLEIDGGNGLLD